MSATPPSTPFSASSLALLPFDLVETPGGTVARLDSGEEIDLSDVVRRLAWKARGKQHPRKSVAAAVRQAAKRGDYRLTRDEAEAVTDLAIDALYRAGSQSDGEWATIARAAQMLQVSVARIRSMLETPEGRRRLGWPWRVDDTEWRIPMAALRPDRSTYIQGLPDADPHGYGSEACDSAPEPR